MASGNKQKQAYQPKRRNSPPPVPVSAKRKKQKKKSSSQKKAVQKNSRRINRKKQRRNLLLLLLAVLGFAFGIKSCGGCFEPSAAYDWTRDSMIWQYEDMLDMALAENGISDYKNVLLSIMQTESAGEGNDVMQASESLDLPLNTLNPQESIDQGCALFASLLAKGNEMGLDLDTVIQAYNYGPGFLDYTAARSGQYSRQLAEEFAKEQSQGVLVEYPNPIAIDYNGGYRYNYGNMFYVDIVHSYLNDLESRTEE